ncbi:hypothetical protein J5N97_025444 [Dioscorea zingiberensis]|uniref:Uncharacterized protein n=1 Tax=Dioscorea zingiberensis TaxID=325984 RepID=A0A9D5C8A1_9LILI|nr:hypothetical protein J5N97_025444 [Dioscorea zingiberensis]
MLKKLDVQWDHVISGQRTSRLKSQQQNVQSPCFVSLLLAHLRGTGNSHRISMRSLQEKKNKCIALLE